MNLNQLSRTQKLALSGMTIALYVVVMYVTQSFAFGQYQVRIATAIYGVAYLCPFLVLPLGLSNLISNMLMGGLGFFDIFGGGLVGILTAGSCALIRHYKLNPVLVGIPIAIIPTFIVSLWLCGIVGISYFAMVLSLMVGQVISGVFAAVLVPALKRALKVEI